MYRNIKIPHSNFCIGPQGGTFCTIDTAGTTAFMRVKNSSGDLIRSYDTYPSSILHPDSHSSTYPYNRVVDFKYVGPVNQASYYDDLTYFTLEKIYTSTGSDSCIIRRWLLNHSAGRLELYQSFTKTGDATDSYDTYAFAVENVRTSFKASVEGGTGVIKMTTTSGLEKYDILMLGPSNDTTNNDAIEYVYVYSISGDDVSIRTINPGVPTVYEYLEDDPIIVFKDIYLFGNASGGNPGSLYVLDSNDYYNKKDKDVNQMYDMVYAAGWNHTLGGLSFCKVANMLTINVLDFEVFKSHTVKNMKSRSAYTPVVGLEFDGDSVYRLQKEITVWDDYGVLVNVPWSTYNYILDTILPYSTSVSLYVEPAGDLVRAQTISLRAKVRDQMGVTLLGKNIQFYKNGDAGAYFTPLNGQGITNSDGEVTISYTSGSYYGGEVKISVRCDGADTHLGSQYIWDWVYCQQHSVFEKEYSFNQISFFPSSEVGLINQILLNKMFTLGPGEYVTAAAVLTGKQVSKFSFPGGHWITSEQPDAYVTTLEQGILPRLHPNVGGYSLEIEIEQDKDVTGLVNYSQIEKHSNTFPIDQTYISRHYSSGHKDDIDVYQFVFVDEAIPVFWSFKNGVDTKIWLRLRPFAASLNPNTFNIQIKEVSYAGNTGWRDITSEGAIVTYDAGGGMDGIEFTWYPSEDFHNNGVVHVLFEVYDTAFRPNRIVVDYWFVLIPDYKMPFVDNLIPAREEYGVAIDTNISFDLLDINTGVDIESFEMTVNYTRVYPDITKVSDREYHVVYNPPVNFKYEKTVLVYVKVNDLSENDNWLLDSWRFFCTESSEPWFNDDNYEPGLCMRGMDKKHNDISMQVYGVGDGVEEESIEVYIGGPKRDVIISPIIYRVS